MHDQKYILMATGGDDNLIHLILLSFLENDFIFVSSLKLPAVHSAQVTSLHLDKVDNSVFNMTSASIDQRIVRHRVVIQKDKTLSSQEQGCSLIYVSDVSSLDVCKENYFICGQGMSHLIYHNTGTNNNILN